MTSQIFFAGIPPHRPLTPAQLRPRPTVRIRSLEEVIAALSTIRNQRVTLTKIYRAMFFHGLSGEKIYGVFYNRARDLFKNDKNAKGLVSCVNAPLEWNQFKRYYRDYWYQRVIVNKEREALSQLKDCFIADVIRELSTEELFDLVIKSVLSLNDKEKALMAMIVDMALRDEPLPRYTPYSQLPAYSGGKRHRQRRRSKKSRSQRRKKNSKTRRRTSKRH